MWSDGESGLVFCRRFFKVFLTVSISGRTRKERKGKERKGKEGEEGGRERRGGEEEGF